MINIEYAQKVKGFNYSPAIAVPKQWAKEGIKQNTLILRPLLQTDAEIRSY